MLQKQNERLEALIRGLRDRTVVLHQEVAELWQPYSDMCAAIDEYRLADKGVGEADFYAVLDSIADLIEAHVGTSEEEVETPTPEQTELYERMEQRFKDVIRANDGRLFQLEMGPLQVSLLHGSLRLAATHPGVKQLSRSYHKVAREVRDACMEFYREMGFTEEEIEYLDTEETFI